MNADLQHPGHKLFRPNDEMLNALSVTPCWCYGSETFDMNPRTIKAVWGFNGTERPGAVYLAAVMADYAQKGLPAFSIYGHDVQDMDDRTIPASPFDIFIFSYNRL